MLAALGIADLFETVYDIRVAGYLPKPFTEPYRAVLDALGVEADRCVMIEDLRDNLRTAKQLGMQTVLVGAGETPSYVDLHLANVRQIHPQLSRLGVWE